VVSRALSQEGPARNASNEPALFPKILVGVDTSQQTARILKLAHLLTKKLNAAVIVCTVANVPTSVQGNEADGFPANRQERGILDRVEELVHQEFDNDAGNVEIKILHGDPGERLSEYAEFSGSELVIVGSRSQGALKKALLGSVSSSVASRCKRSVLILR
jgi:nucleotide-binding universal stress UspA family protein